MVNMKLEYIKAVLALSKSKSFGEAAENVFSTQSSLSKQILSVEKELGIKLIHRATKKDSIRLTHEGEIFVKHAAGIVEEYNALLDELKQERDVGRQEIHLGFSVKSHISPDFLVKFQYEYPQCVIKVWNVGYSEAVTAMQNKSLDAAIFPYMMLESDSMQIIPFYHDPAFSVIELSNLCEVVVEMSEDNPLSKLKEVSIDQLKDETFIMNSKQTGSTSDFYTDTSDPLVRACISRGFYPKASDKIMVIGNDMKTAHMLGTACTDASLGINNWLVSVFAPIFGGQSTIMLLLICVVFITVVTQVVNGNVLTMGMTPIIVPIVCGMMEQGIKIDPTVTLTVISTCASVAFLFPSGSVAAAYILGREEIDKKFLFTKGVAVLAIYMLVQFTVAVLFNAVV